MLTSHPFDPFDSGRPGSSIAATCDTDNDVTHSVIAFNDYVDFPGLTDNVVS